MFIDNLAIPKGAKHVDAAHKFINYILRPEVSRKISEEFPYTNPNVEARKLLTPEERANPASYPPGDPKLATFRDIGPMAANVDKLVTDLKAKSGASSGRTRGGHDHHRDGRGRRLAARAGPDRLAVALAADRSGPSPSRWRPR